MKDNFQNEIFQDTFSSATEWRWFFLLGVLFIVLGFVALSMPVASTLGLTLALAGVLVALGFIRLVNAFRVRHRRGAPMRFFQSAVSIVVGGLMFRYPGGGMLGIAFALSFYFFTSAAVQCIISYAHRPEPGWWGELLNSVLSFFLGALIILTFPFSALWIPGTLLGVELLFSGSVTVGMAWAHRKAGPRDYRSSLKASGAT